MGLTGTAAFAKRWWGRSIDQGSSEHYAEYVLLTLVGLALAFGACTRQFAINDVVLVPTGADILSLCRKLLWFWLMDDK